jgi:Tat protein translocase TatB subunit
MSSAANTSRQQVDGRLRVFGIEAPELLVLLVVGLLVFGPDRLPEMARQAGSWMRDLRRMVAKARRDLSEGIGVDEADLRKLQNLDPKTYVRRNVLDGLDLDLGLDDKPVGPNGRPAGSGRTAPAGSAAPAGSGPAETPFDPDTT